MKPTLLVIDDEKSITKIVGRIAADLGYDVFAVNDPSLALAAFEDVQPDVVLLDLVMPDVDGIDILRGIAATGVRTRIVLMSGFGAGYLRLGRAVAVFEDRPDIIELAKPFRRSDIAAVLGHPISGAGVHGRLAGLASSRRPDGRLVGASPDAADGLLPDGLAGGARRRSDPLAWASA